MNRFIEHIINDLVRDTRINYDREEVHFPFLSYLSPPIPFLSTFIPFSKYCKNTYGLTEEEIDYVWNQYKGIIKDKFTNR
jgi:hypothetical protein